MIKKGKSVAENQVDDTLLAISEIKKKGLKFWDGLKIYVDTTPVDKLTYHSVFDVLKRIKDNKDFTSINIETGKRALSFIEENQSLYEEIRNLSKLEDVEGHDIKEMYDRIKALSKDDWMKIIDLGGQTKTFSNLELSNIKAVQTAIIKKENPKEQALYQTFLSIKKLNKFGVKI